MMSMSLTSQGTRFLKDIKVKQPEESFNITFMPV